MLCKAGETGPSKTSSPRNTVVAWPEHLIWFPSDPKARAKQPWTSQNLESLNVTFFLLFCFMREFFEWISSYFILYFKMILWHKNLDSVSHTEASSDMVLPLAAASQGKGILWILHPTWHPSLGMLELLKLDLPICGQLILPWMLCVLDHVQPEPNLHSGFCFIEGQKKSDWHKAFLFSHFLFLYLASKPKNQWLPQL